MNVDELIIETFKKAVNIMEEKTDPKSVKKTNPNIPTPKIIYPCYSDKKTRISEQEIKQLFIQTLIEDKENDFYFSVETPTEFKYRFSNSDRPRVYNEKTDRDNIRSFESARFDLCLYQIHQKKFIRKHLIEFKANNPNEKNIKKDFLKLFLEEQKQEELNNYFIHILDSANDDTLKSIKYKYYHSWYYCTNNSYDDCTNHNSCKYSTWKKIKAQNIITVYLFIQKSSKCYKIKLGHDYPQSSDDIVFIDYTEKLHEKTVSGSSGPV